MINIIGNTIGRYIIGGSGIPALTPAEITGLRAWWKADTGVTLSGPNVTDVADQSGNANHLVNAGNPFAAPGPTMGTGLNGLPAITFNGVDQVLSQQSTEFKEAGADAGDWTFIIVGSIEFYRGYDNWNIRLGGQDNFVLGGAFHPGNARPTGSRIKTMTVDQQAEQTIVNSYDNGSHLGEAIIPAIGLRNSAWFIFLGIAFGTYVAGYLQEMAIWRRALTVDELAGLHEYSTNKYL